MVQRPLQVDQDTEAGGRQYACSSCRITYAVPRKSQPKCPLCDANRRIAELQLAMTALRNQLELTSDAAASLRTAVDIQLAMRHAVEVADANDLTFLKTVLYRCRDDQSSITMRALFGPARKPRGAPRPIGFQAQPANSEAETHLCTSVGGVAIAGYFDEVARQTSCATAMTALIKALSQCLAGATR